MKIISWNVNGIRSIYNKGFLKWLKKEKPDILCLQEIKSNLEDIPIELREIKGYFSYWDPSDRKGYGGTAVFSKQKPIKVSYGFGIKKFDKEGRVMILSFPKFILANFYFPHGRRDKSKLPYKLEMYRTFERFLKKFKGKTVLCGDFNIAHKEIDLARPKDNKNNAMFTPDERKQIDIILDKNYTDTFRKFHKEPGKYTWWPYWANARKRNLGWRIDYVFVSDKLSNNLKDAFILPNVKGSDHCPIGIKVET